MVGKRVLVIDDDRGMTELIRLSLEAEGCEVSTFLSAELGLEAALSAPPDAIIFDLMAAHGSNHFAYRRLRQEPRTAKVPVVLCTARGERTIRRELDERPPMVLFKPFRVPELIEAVRRALAGQA